MQVNCAIYNLLQKDNEFEKLNFQQTNSSIIFPPNFDYLFERLNNKRYEEFQSSYICKDIRNHLKTLLDKRGQNRILEYSILFFKESH